MVNIKPYLIPNLLLGLCIKFEDCVGAKFLPFDNLFFVFHHCCHYHVIISFSLPHIHYPHIPLYFWFPCEIPNPITYYYIPSLIKA